MLLALSGCSLGLPHRPAQAQAFNPGVLNPGLQQQQQLQDQQLERLPQVEREEPKPLFTEEEPSGPAPSADDPELLINQVRLQGNSVLSSAELEAPFAPLLGKPIRFAQLQQALNAGSNLYRDRGYFTSRLVLPEGGLRDGVLTVLAVEGYLEAVEVSGKGSDGLKAWVRRYLAPVTASRGTTGAPPPPIRFDALERQLLLLQSIGGVRFGATLAPGQAFAGSKLLINLDPKLLSASVAVNNNLQQQLGDAQLSANLSANLLTAQPVQLDLGGSIALPDPQSSRSGTVALATPIGNRGLKLNLSGALTKTLSQNLAPASGFDVESGGTSTLGSLALRYPLLLSRQSSVNLSLQGDLQNSSNNAYVDGREVSGSTDRLRVIRLGLDASHSTPFAASTASLTLSQGLDGLGAEVSSQSPALANPLAEPVFTKAQLTLRHQQRLGGSNAFLTLTGLGQLAANPLPTPEDFSYGGPFLGRAYRGSVLIGDQGIAGGVELSHAFYPSASTTLTPFVFADVGYARNREAGEAVQESAQAASYGLGLRGSWASNASFEVGWAIPAANTVVGGRDGPANSIVYFRASLGF